MIIRKVDFWLLKLPFLTPIKHHLATHDGSENIVVKVTLDSAFSGYGEGVPRSFVTGESLADSVVFLERMLAPAALGQKFATPPELLATLEAMRGLGTSRFPAAFCALETALLDAAGKAWNKQVGDLIGPRLHDNIVYSAVIPMASEEKIVQLLQLVKMNRMRFVKLKVGAPDDLSTLRRARDILGPEVDLRVDANSAWSAREAIDRIREMEPFHLSAVEQPVPKEDFQGLKTVREGVGVPIIADESLCTEEDARRLIDLEACQLFNIRLSKCGGLVAATKIRDLAAAAGIRCQLGCHVGETSILAAAGRHFALTSPDLAYVEGSFAPYLLRQDPVASPVVFGEGGLAHNLPGPGLGITVSEEALNELAVTPQGGLEAAG